MHPENQWLLDRLDEAHAQIEAEHSHGGKEKSVSKHPFRTNKSASNLRWSEAPASPKLERELINKENSYLRCYRLGECGVIVTKEFDEWHLSISHPIRYPTWDEVAQARYHAIPKHIWMAMMLPPPEHYVNLHENCLHLVQVPEPSNL